MQFEKAHLNTIIAALRLYQMSGYCEPTARPDWIHVFFDNDEHLEAHVERLVPEQGRRHLERLPLNEKLPLIGTVPATGPTLQESLTAIWDVLYSYQDDSIPAEKYRTMADDVGAEDPMWHIYDDTATAYEAEWDDICHHMALIHEALNIPQEDV